MNRVQIDAGLASFAETKPKQRSSEASEPGGTERADEAARK
jgi:hypothetical protein